MSADWQRGFSWFATQNDRATSRVLSLQRRGRGRSLVWPVTIEAFPLVLRVWMIGQQLVRNAKSGPLPGPTESGSEF